MRSTILGMLIGGLSAFVTPVSHVSGDECGNLLVEHSSTTPCCSCGKECLLVDKLTNDGPNEITMCLVVTSTANIEDWTYFPQQCFFGVDPDVSKHVEVFADKEFCEQTSSIDTKGWAGALCGNPDAHAYAACNPGCTDD